MSKLAELESEVSRFRDGTGRECISVVGGLQGYDGEGWKDWIVKQLEWAGVRIGSEDLYWKGYEFKGMLWVKFWDRNAREKCIRVLKGLGCSGLWAAPDKPLEERVLGSFMLSLKKQLVQWGEVGSSECRVEIHSIPATMAVGGRDNRRVVAEAKVKKWEGGGGLEG